MLQHAKQEQQQRNKNGYVPGDNRPAALVRKYGELYSQVRLETLDALDKLPELINSDELKNKLLFSVVVVSLLSPSFLPTPASTSASGSPSLQAR